MEKSELILNKLASGQGRRDEIPNIELAMEIVETEDLEAVKVLAENLKSKKEIRRDCIKTLYEIGDRKPEFIASHLTLFLDLLESKDNRMQWGAMTAISCISRFKPEDVYAHLPQILKAAETGSVITRDHAVKTLIHIGTQTSHTEEIFQMLHEILLNAPVNQFPTYVEETEPLVNDQNKHRFISTVEQRMDEMNTAAKTKRLKKVVQRLTSPNHSGLHCHFPRPSRPVFSAWLHQKPVGRIRK